MAEIALLSFPTDYTGYHHGMIYLCNILVHGTGRAMVHVFSININISVLCVKNYGYKAIKFMLNYPERAF